MADVNYIFFLSLAIICIGYIIKKLKIITEENGKVIAKIIFNITLPAVILQVTSTLELSINLVFLPIIIMAYCLIILLLGLFIFKNYSKEVKGIILMTIIGFNIANFSFPLIEGIYGVEGLQYIALVDAGNGFIIFFVIYLIATIFSPKTQKEEIKINSKYIAKSILKSVPLMSYIIGLSLNFSGLNLPIFVMDIIDIFARANSALVLLLLGILLSFKFEKTEWNTVLKVLLMRYTFGLILGLLLYFFLPIEIFNSIFRIVIAVALILPIGMAIIPFSIEFEYNEKLVGMMVTITIIISFILMWILILLLG